MPHDIYDREEVRALVERGARLVEVLPGEEYDEEHLPGAINIPLRRIAEEAPRRLDRADTVIVYCFDFP